MSEAATSGAAAAPYWKAKRLEEMTEAEWEALCDGCGRCCLNKIDDIETGEITATRVACRLLDLDSCRCTGYEHRRRLVSDCVAISPANVDRIPWMPRTCAYRLIAEGKDLAWWHPLVSGDPESVHEAGISVRGRVVSERRITGPLEDYVVDWEF